MKAAAVIVRDLLGTYGLYRIALFQRHYSWKHEQWKQLCTDVLHEMGTAPDGPHFPDPLPCVAAGQASEDIRCTFLG